MFRPNNSCILSPVVEDAYTASGDPVFAARRVVPCSVVRLSPFVERTSVRTDFSGSRGAADEIVFDAKILFPTSVFIKIGDKVEIAGFELIVNGVHPRFDTQGNLDHYEVMFRTA